MWFWKGVWNCFRIAVYFGLALLLLDPATADSDRGGILLLLLLYTLWVGGKIKEHGLLR